MSHSKTPYSPNFPSSHAYSQPGSGAINPTAPYPHQEPAGSYPQPSNPTPYPMPLASPIQMQPGFKPSYQADDPPSAGPGQGSPAPQPAYPIANQHGFAPIVSGYQPPPVMRQPLPGGWMNIPQGVPNCPPGLEYLSMIDQLLMHQKVELLETFVGYETNNKYTIKNSIGQKVYHAIEDNDCCTRMCCGSARPFDMKVFDNHRNEVIHLYRPLACDSCCFPCCLQRMEVTAPPGHVIGSIEQEWSLCKPMFNVKNAAGEDVLRIKGPVCQFSMCGDVRFNVYSKDGETKVGKITKQWSGLAREMFTDTDYFGITFPMDLDVKMKAVLLGACFLIDFMYFEKSGNRE